MNNLQIGKMYLVKEYFWLLFPTKELAERSLGRVSSASTDGERASHTAKVFSNVYNSNVAVVEENTCFVLLEQQDEVYFKLLDSNGNVGWIRCWDFSDFSNYFELVKE